MALNSTRWFGILGSRGMLRLCQRTIVSKALREPREKPPPYPYLEKNFGYITQMTDRTTPRLDENSKLIVVEGTHAIGKTALAKELADQFEMKYMGPVSHEDIYIGPYNTDYRKWNDLYPDWFKCFDDKDFIRNPTGHYEGTVDRYFNRIYKMKWANQLRAQQHILNTGQGVVMEGCVHSDPIYLNAAYDVGWISDEMKSLYHEQFNNTYFQVLKPNLIVYLDASVDQVQRNIKARGNEWDKDSPVWNNTQYLSNIYNEYRNNYLRDMQEHCRVLAYDWSEEGDTEVVVEDIENTELDMIECYSNQQKDWRFGDEIRAASVRYQCTNSLWVRKKMNYFKIDNSSYSNVLVPPMDQLIAMEDVFRHISSERFAPGANAHLGDDTLMLKLFGWMKNKEHKTFMNWEGNRFFDRDRHPEAYSTSFEFKGGRLE